MTMNKFFIFLLFTFTANFVYSQNSFLKNLYSLNSEINTIQKQLKEQEINNEILKAKFELTKSLNRLSEEALSESLDGNLARELAQLISYACELGKQKLDFLESYKTYNNKFYLQKFTELDNIYLSIYLKIKTKE